MKKIVIGQIVADRKIMGTGFLISSDIVMTVKHNVITADDLLDDDIGEKEVVFRIDENDEVIGKTINLLEAIEKGIDCVFVRLNENICNNKIQVLVNPENDLTDFNCHIIGFPKLSQGKTEMSGKIISQLEEILVFVKKENQLQNYEGLSGAPIIILGNVVGIIVKQENSENLEALSIKKIIENLECEEISILKKEVPNCFFENEFNLYKVKQKVEQVISMVGPRYSKNLNIKTGTYNNLSFMLKKDGIAERLQDIGDRVKDCIKKLNEFDSYNQAQELLVLSESRMEIQSIVSQLQLDSVLLDSVLYKENELQQIFEHLKQYEQNLNKIFEIEKIRFEERNGEGTYNNKSWRGFMASYMCVFPAHYLDELREVINTLTIIAKMLDISLISNVSNRAILIMGKGGIGKTHLLCDIVNEYFEHDITAILLLGDMFKGNVAADSVIMNWFQSGEEIEKLFAWLNEYGNQNNVYIPICIDAINEVDNTSYWNSNLPLILAKAESYSNIKIIVSCRSIYLEEYLDEEKIIGMLQLPHNGFDEMEVEALSDFCKYYGVNINYDTTCVPEFMNPLFLKMLCEIAKEKNDKTVVVDDIKTLMDDFFSLKNKTISKKYDDYFSVRDNIVSLALSRVTQYMADNDQYSTTWNELRKIISDILETFGIKEKAAGFIKLLISENLLREADDKGREFTFAYQKFYEYLYAQKYANEDIEIVINAVEEKKITLGTLEMIQIAYFKSNKEEFLNVIKDKIHGESVEAFMSGLYWRSEGEINKKTINVIERLFSSSQESDVRRVILGLIAVSTKNKCEINAFYIHNKLKNMNNYRRDYVLSFFLLKQYDQVKVISDICERAQSLDRTTFSEESILLWKIILCWGTGSNDIKLRDKASKGLVNLFRIYPVDMLTIIEMFSEVDDDYIHERIWQAIYSALILLAKQKYCTPILEFIKNNIIEEGAWPQNVLVRDYLRNIFEFAYYNGWCDSKEILLARPPYKSKKHESNKQYEIELKDEFSKLYWNCINSDFAKYTIPSEVEDYGVSKKNVGLMIFEDIVKSGYKSCKKYDGYIDYTYGSLRNRDEQVERIGKKYQKIYLYREMGNIYDNYKYKPRYRYDEAEIISPEQGNSFRKIDLTILCKENNFKGTRLVYPFYRYNKWDDMTWFKNNDVERYIPNLILCTYEGKEFYMLQGYLSSKESGEKDFREIWMQVRMYFYQKEKKYELLEWFKQKDFEGRWMPEGFGQLYECCIGEYPWSPTMINYLGQEEEQNFRQEAQAPCHLITTINDYTAEKDSPFCSQNSSSYMFPSKYLFEKMNLSWNSSYGYNTNGQTVIINGQNNTIYINKEYLIEFLNQNNLEVAWTLLGEKQKITGNFGRDFPGRSEFSYTYYLSDESELTRNHEVYNVMKSGRY